MEQELKLIEEKFELFINGRSKRPTRHNFFSEICTNLQAYLLGFIASDGSVNEKRHSLSIQISKVDEELFELFKIICPDAYIYQRKTTKQYKNPHSNNYITDHGTVKLTIHSKALYNDLVSLGITQGKTYKDMHIPSQLNKKYIPFFILGYLDGDGYITNRTKLLKTSGGYISCKAGICSKTNSLLLEFQQFFKENNINALISQDNRDKIYYLDICAKQSLQNLYNLLYKSTSLGLDRKRIKLYRFLHDNENLKAELIKKKLSNL